MRASATTLLIAGALCSCVGYSDVPLATDVVKDERAAIQIGIRKCSKEDQDTGSARWYARLQNGIWVVWLGTPIPTDHCALLSTKVRASDGKAEDCMACFDVPDESSP